MRLYLGVDGGQSSTTALVGDDAGRVLGTGSAGPCNHVGASEGREKLMRAIQECVSRAFEHAGLQQTARPRFEAACFGMSGGPADKRLILAEILETPLLTVTTDAAIALSGAIAGKPGVITIAGTGSIAFGRNADGRTARAGGWGYVFGDEGGAFDIARQALRAALRHEEGWGPQTALHPMLLAATGAADANDLLHRFYTSEYPRPRIAAFSRLVDEAALNGDRAASGILQAAAQQLATLSASVRMQLWRTGEDVQIAYIGGVFRSSTVRERFRALTELEEGNRCGPPVFGPAAGALLQAYQAAGLNPILQNVPEFKE
ncbi:MAG: ATPase [Bryobacterales bacterium]|nr:ATPase [Bryobacterales bacterium]